MNKNINESSSEARVRMLSSAVRASAVLERMAGGPHAGRGSGGSPVPFITISRQAGAGGRSLAERLVERLNQSDPDRADGHAWTSWDNELVQKVAEEHHLPESVVASMEHRRNAWLQDALAALTQEGSAGQLDEFRVFRRVALTIRALAEAGRVVIVGRGGVYITRGLPGGVHVRLVAPLEWRVEHFARRFDLSADKAAARVRQIDHERNAFYRRYWPDHPLDPETFTLTVNTAAVAEDRLVDCVVSLLPRPAGAASRGGAAAPSAAAPGRRFAG